jgi:predicted lipase
MLKQVSHFLDDHPNAKVFVTGHSLGAAVALLASLAIELEHCLSGSGRLIVATFGAPRTGTRAWQKVHASTSRQETPARSD